MKYVNCYEVDRCYGGPQEGGWYYDAGMPVASIPVDDEATEEQVEEIRASLYERFGQPRTGLGRYSAANYGADVEVYVEESFAEPFPKTRPYYE